MNFLCSGIQGHGYRMLTLEVLPNQAGSMLDIAIKASEPIMGQPNNSDAERMCSNC